MREEMNQLIESKVSQRKKKRGLVCGIGHYDVDFPNSIRIDGKEHKHGAYEIWHAMLSRCYKSCTERAARNYAGCTICDSWLYFSNFLMFYKENYRNGWQLDKDLLFPGNKIYSPERCVFVPPALNTFTTDRAHARGEHPQGVNWHKRIGKFRASINANGKLRHLGYFTDAYESHLAWHKAKMEQAQNWEPVCGKIHPDLFSGLITKVKSMLEVQS